VSFPQCCLTVEGLRQTDRQTGRQTDRQTRATHSLRHMEYKNPTTERNKKSRTSLRSPGQAHAAATNVAPRAAVALPSEVSVWDGRTAGLHFCTCRQRTGELSTNGLLRGELSLDSMMLSDSCLVELNLFDTP